jgi:hypothetical protein
MRLCVALNKLDRVSLSVSLEDRPQLLFSYEFKSLISVLDYRDFSVRVYVAFVKRVIFILPLI